MAAFFPSQAESTTRVSTDADLWQRAEAVAAVAAEFADDVDQKGRFPTEAVQAMKQHRLLSLMISRDEGGEGATMSQLSGVASRIAGGCSSSGMVFAMHYSQLANLVRHAQTDQFADKRRSICERQLLLASATTEKGIGGDVRRSTCFVDQSAERFELVKDAPVISYAEFSDAILVTARRNSDAAPNDQVLVWTDTADASLDRTQDWDTLGLRGTCSHGYVLTVHGEASAILPGSYADISSQTMLPTAHILWSSVWTGIAEKAMSIARAKVQKDARKAHGEVPPGALRLAEAEFKLNALRAATAYEARIFDTHAVADPSLDSAARVLAINGLKVLSSTTAVELVGQALAIVGIEGYRQGRPMSLGRQLRDSYGAMLMVNNDRILGNSASLELINRQVHA